MSQRIQASLNSLVNKRDTYFKFNFHCIIALTILATVKPPPKPKHLAISSSQRLL